jgi:hypothetical protein
MLKIKKGLANILENNNNEPEEAPQPPQPQTPQSVRTVLKLNEPEVAPQASQLFRSAEPAVQPPQPPAAPRQVGDQIGWEEHLIQALAKAPDDVAQKLAACIDREVLLMALLKRRDDPYLKVALLILKK